MVKKTMRILIFVLISSIAISLFAFDAKAITQDSAPYETHTVGPDGFILTQTAYEPTGNMVIDTELNQPEDIFIQDNYIYIADTGNKRVLKIDFQGVVHLTIDNLNRPTGIHVDKTNNIYVADRGNKTVYKFDDQGQEIQRYDRPTEPLFGKNTAYEPIKVVSGPRDILYIVGAGATDGLIQLNSQGEFLGFFATNPVKKSFWQNVSDLFGVRYAKTIPISADNVAIDEKGSVYTVSKTTNRKLKKFNISSTISLSVNQRYTPIAVTINDFGNMYTISEEGIINEYDSYGNLIFQFGAIDSGNKVLGKFVNPVDLEIDVNNNLYILDKGSNAISILVKSEFANKIHEGLINYKNGIYDINEWREVLQKNSFFSLANKSIANALYRADEYDEALSYFKIANDKEGYSEAFWQVRYNWLQNYLTTFFIVMFGLFITSKSLSLVDRKYDIYDPLRNANKQVGKLKVVKESKYLFKILRHPIDTAYYLKREQKSSYLTATLIYLAFGLLTLISLYATGFIFNTTDLADFAALKEVATLMAVILLFVVGNHLISSLQSGEGWFKDIYIGVAYALSPVLISIVPLILLSHVLTLNEIFIYSATNFIAWSWTIILIIIMIKEVHNYTLKELIVNLLLTFFTMLMIILIMFLVYLLSIQLFDYVEGLIREVILRV